MFNLWAPITYNTNLGSLLSNYYFGLYRRNYALYLPLLNSSWYNAGAGVSNPYFNIYQRNNYPSIYTWNYSTPVVNPALNRIYIPQVSASQNVFQYNYYSNKTSSPVKQKTVVNNSNKSEKVDKKVNTNSVNTVSKTRVDLGQDFVKTARKYSNVSEENGLHHKFCINSTCKSEDPLDQEWCTDFVTYVVKETYKDKGKTPPLGFGNHDVETLKNWAINNGYFIRTSNKSQKAAFISENIKPGDIVIFNENDASHTGFVTGVNKDSGVIHTIEGNHDDKVTEYSYSPNLPDISGFIRLTS